MTTRGFTLLLALASLAGCQEKRTGSAEAPRKGPVSVVDLQETAPARRLEGHLNKEEILYLYLNQIYLGHGAYGVQAAAENYFGKSIRKVILG